MTTKDIFSYEDSNPGTIRLHREGMFAKAYERSAFLLSRLKSLKPSVKFIKAEGREIISVGMPMETAFELLKELPHEDNGMTVVYKAASPVDETEYLQWRETAPKASASRKTVKKEDIPARDSLREEIRDFNLSGKTPIECMNFVAHLKEIISKENRI